MSRFQASTSAVLDGELEELRDRLGLRPNQKAELLRELTLLASWVVRQAEAGRTIEARVGSDREPLVNPALDRLRSRGQHGMFRRIELDRTEVEALARVLSRPFAPTPELRESLSRLANPDRAPPHLEWENEPSS